MKTQNSAEMEWFRRLNGTSPKKEKHEDAPQKEDDEPAPAVEKKDEGSRGLADVAGMDWLKQFLKESFINVLKFKDYAKAFNITPPSLLLYGPAGCGKTYIAEKIAEELGINFMKVIPDDIACQFIHGTQEKIAELFSKAESKAPVLLFFDEFDEMVPKRTNDNRQSQNGETNEFLCKLNNAHEKGIYVVAATNHPERIDRAVLRTGRIDELIYVDMPDTKARESLFRLNLSKLPASESIDYERLAELTKGYNCSDISYIIKVASRKTFNAIINDVNKPNKVITQELLEESISQKTPSVSSSDLKDFERIRKLFSHENDAEKRPAIGFAV